MHVGNIISNLAQDIHQDFRQIPNLGAYSVRFFGSQAKAAIHGDVTPSAIYDLDIGIIVKGLTDDNIAGIKSFFEQEAMKYSSKDISIDVALIHGPLKPKPEPDKQKILLHLLLHSEREFEASPKFFRLGYREFGIQITGQLPHSGYITRLGISDIQPEPDINMRFLLGTKKYNKIPTEKGQVHIEPQLDRNGIEMIAYCVDNCAKNTLSAFSPYITLPHFDNSPEVFREFRRVFPNHPYADLPLALYDIKTRARNGETVNIDGLKEQALNFLSFTDQMLRNISGN